MSKVRPPGGAELYRRLLRYVRRYAGVFSLAVLGMLVNAASNAGFAELIGRITDEAFVAQDPRFIRLIPYLFVGLAVVRGIAGFLDTYCMRWVGRRVIFDVREDMFRSLLRVPNRYYDDHSSASFVSRFVFDVEQLSTAATAAITTLVRDAATVLILLGYMFYKNWQLAAIFLIIVPPLAILVRWMSKRLRKISRQVQASMRGITHVVKEAVQGQRVVKIFHGQDQEAQNFFSANNRNRQQAMKRATVAALSPGVVELFAAGAFALIIYQAAQFQLAGEMTVGTFIGFITAMLLLMSPARRLTKINEPIQTGIVAAESAFSLIDEAPEVDTGKRRLKRARGQVEFRDVGFRYTEERNPVLHEVSFLAQPGQTVALVGPSGAGKSSVAALLARLYPVGQGEVLIDDVDISTVRLADLRANLSVVTQETILFNDTIARNITYGSRFSKSRLQRAVQAAHVLEFVDRLPEGLETRVGEQGLRLSGGQRQRIAIARALYKDAPILILDEATSSLDAASEQQVQKAAAALMAQRTTLVIAHRLSTIVGADRIIVLRQGRVVETGTHRQLLDRKSTRLNSSHTDISRMPSSA